MSDVVSGLSERDFAELCAFADGTLPAERRAAVEARVAADPGLQELVDRQRRAVTATAALAEEPVPQSLQAAVQEQRRTRRPSRTRASWLAPRLGLAGAVAAAVAIVAVSLGGEAGAPSVADAAQLAAQPPSEPAPARSTAGGARLAADVEGVVFPDFRQAYGWRPVGARHGKLDGRKATVVYYAKGRRRVAYAIVSGSALPRPSDARSTVIGGVRFQTARLDGRPGVTWRRDGHTCVLIGAAPRGELLRLASY
jgi:anti-sigma factor RsiW